MSKKSGGKQSSQQQTDQGVPGVRGRAPGSVQEAPASMQQPALQPSKLSAARAERPPAAHTYSNYSKWDKFDPDGAPDQPAAAKQASKPNPAANSTMNQLQPRQPAAPQASTAEEVQPSITARSSPAAEATALKDRGNKLFQAGYYDDAVGCYTQSIALKPTSLSYANRAMARLKLGQPAEAEQDCTAALQLDSSYIKALHRRGTARRQLGRLLEAAVDFEEALRLEPGNATVQADRDAALEQHLQQQKLQASSAVWSSIPVTAPPPQKQQQQQQQPQQQQDTQEQAAVTEAASSQHVTLMDDTATAATAAAGDADSKVAAAAVNAISSTAAAAAAAAARQQPSRSPSPQPASTAAAAAAAAAALAARRAASLKAPRTGNDFEAAWRSFKGDVQLQAKYLALLSVQHLPVIFKTSLTAPLLRDILTAALTAAAGSAAAAAAAGSSDPESSDAGSSSSELSAGHAVGLLQQLPKLPRFDMTAMCLTSRDKAALREVWDAAAAALGSTDIAEQLAAVRPKYRL
uniref:RNA-polymerase II-associated protein 3-like C-terminal domain-containing protein n=1 Tax=Tetradesmus obliquus TaxID=3088 RepID=A0A383V547_TETOB